MADRNSIITLPHLHLRERSAKIKVVSDDVKTVIEDMKTATLDWEASRPHEVGVALAAVQIDKLLRIVIIRNDFDDKDDRSFAILINPEIIKFEGKPEYDHEGCLSVKDIYGIVPRYPKVRIRAMDVNGNDIRLRTEGFLARVLQHEIDHTNGIMFIDHVKDKKSFFKLNTEGKLESISYEAVKKTGILR